MFGGDDDDDFTPGSSSKLASLFGLGKPSQDGNTSFTYTAPKQPKKGRADSQTASGQASGQSSSSPAKLSIIFVKAVHTYKLADGNYNAQGKLGAAVLGNVASRVYQLLLYKGKQQHVTSTRITPSFQFVVQANNYATFYDDQMQNWSIMFENNEDAIEFAREIGLARANAAGEQSEHNLLMQDLLFGVGSEAKEGDSMEIRYVLYPFSAGKLGEEVENTNQDEKPQRVRLKKNSWEEGLCGMAKGCRRMIILTSAFAAPWRSKLGSDSGAVLEVSAVRIKLAKTASHTDSGESAVDSSTDDTSIKARGASISEALTNSPKTHKASIISRMARMGQATLPLKGAVTCNPSDSEETEEELSGPGDKTPLKTRLTKPRAPAPAPAPAPVQAAAAAPVHDKPTVQMLPQQMAVYQPIWQQPPPQPQFLRTNGSMAYVQSPGQLYPLVTQQAVGTQPVYPVSTPPAVPSPESHLSVFLAETRTQNSEVRMNVAKVADKVDQVLMKLEGMQLRQPNVVSSLEPASLLASIQKLVLDNEQLRAELQDKRAKVEEQSDKIYQLLHSNQMYMEKSSNNGPLQALVLSLQQEKTKLSADLKEALSRTATLDMEIAKADKSGQGLKEEMAAQSSQLKLQQTEMERGALLMQEQEQKLELCSKSLQELQMERDQLERKLQETTLQLQQERAATEELIRSHETNLAKQLSELSSSNTKEFHELEDLQTKCSDLQQENADLKQKLQTKLQQTASTTTEVKNVMNLVYHTLQPLFLPEASYDGAKIRQTLMATIREVTLKYIEVKSEAPGTAKPVQKSVPQDGEQEVANSSSLSTSKDSQHLSTKEAASSEQASEESSDKPEQELESLPVGPITKVAEENQKKPSSLVKQDEVHETPAEGREGERIEPQLEPKGRGRIEPQLEQKEGGRIEPQLEQKEGGRIQPQLEHEEREHTQGRGDSAGPPSDVRVTEDSLQAGKNKEKQSREPSLERSWRPQPPPPPLFDDDDDDDDWLS